MEERVNAENVYINVMSNPKIYFSEHFEISHKKLEDAGFLDISLVCDNPAFVDPFLVFANPKYKELHNFILGYLQFLRDESLNTPELSKGQFEHFYKFPEVKQAWLGYSVWGNSGLGLGRNFADSLFGNLHSIFKNFGAEKITESAHMEKLCLVADGVGVDKISDFTLNLIKSDLLQKTQNFAVKNIDKRYLKEFAVNKVYFNPTKKVWEGAKFTLPSYTWDNKTDYLLLVPIDLLAKEETWISKNDFLDSNHGIFSTIPNEELREKMNRFFLDNLLTKLNKKKKVVRDNSKKSQRHSLKITVRKYPDLLDYYIKQKEDSKQEALDGHTIDPESVNFFEDTEDITQNISIKKYGLVKSYEDCIERITFYKQVIESNAKNLRVNGVKLQEKHLQLLFKLTTYNSLFNYDAEVNNGRGPIDFVISMGSKDKTGLEFKLASNTKLRQNLENQTDVYKLDSNLKYIIKVIFFFTTKELNRVNKILDEIKKSAQNESIILIDCREKDSASNVK